MLEPFVFVATLATYLEFPAIQDLIYTKICLQVLTKNQQQQQLNDDNHLNTAYSLAFELNHTNISPLKQVTSNSSLPTFGRIQELNVLLNNTTNLQTINQLLKPIKTDIYSMCSRLNQRSVPSELRLEILDAYSMFWLKYQLIISVLCVLSSPYWGGISDKIGRLIPLNVPIVASMLSNMISLGLGVLINMGDYHEYFQIQWLFTGAILVGLSGGQAVLLSNSFSYLSDNTSSEDRTKRVTILESIIFMAHSLGFYLSKLAMALNLPGKIWLNKHFIAFGACLLLNFSCLLYSFFNLRHRKFHRFLNNFEREQQEITTMAAESSLRDSTLPKVINETSGSDTSLGPVPIERPRELTASTPDDLDGPVAKADKSNWTFWDTMITIRYFKETYSSAMKSRESRAVILLLLLSGFISALSLTALMSLFFVFVKQEPFNWTTSQYSAWNSISSTARGSALIALTVCMKFYSGCNVPDSLVASLGFVSKALGLLVIGLARDSADLYIALACFTLSEYTMSPIRSLLSKLVVNEELCKIYSCLGSLQSVCFILGNVIFYMAFNYTFTRKDYFRISFGLVASLEFCAAIIMLVVYTSLRRRLFSVN